MIDFWRGGLHNVFTSYPRKSTMANSLFNINRKHAVLPLLAAFLGFNIIGNALLAQTAFAAKTIHESFIGINDSVKTFGGDVTGGQLGSEIKAADLNSDGFDDLIVSAPLASESDKKWNGEVKIIFGGSYKEVNIFGENEGDQLGRAISVGDFNNDGQADLAVGSHNAYNKSSRPGKVYIFWGGKGLDNIADLGLQAADQELDGTEDKAGFGLSLHNMDFNEDGFDDLLVGSPFAKALNNSASGLVYGYLGGKSGLSTIPRVFFYGQEPNERFGSVIEHGDLNGDGESEVVIGGYRADHESGQQSGNVYIFEGKSKPTFVFLKPDQVLEGTLDGGWFGFSISVGRLNNDDFDDLAISSFPYWGDRRESQVSIFYGGEKFHESTNLMVREPIGETLLGQDVLLRDLNGDSKAEIIMGAPGVNDVKSKDEGLVYVVYSGLMKYKSKYNLGNREADSFIYGEKSDDWFGSQLEVLDMNGDSYADLAVSAIYADSEQGQDAGKVYVIFGNGEPFGEEKVVSFMEELEVSRGELIKEVVEKFDLKNKKALEIENCYSHRDFCLFNFMAMSSYDDLQLEPELILYPDVRPGDEYFEYINIATVLGIVNGFMNDKDSPFNEDLPISRIQALKIILGASDMVAPKYKFELVKELGSSKNLVSQKTVFTDVNAAVDHMWWYPRYVNFAVENGIVPEGEFFRPDEYITREELDMWIGNTLKVIKVKD